MQRLLAICLALLAHSCSTGECEPACAKGFACFAGVCKPFNPVSGGCKDDAICALGQRCVVSSCRNTLVSCVDVTKCRSGEVCTGNHCVDPARDCLANEDCDQGDTCEFNRCVTLGACIDERDCGPGEICDTGKCTDDVIECDSNDDCDDRVCEDGRCADP